MCFRTGINVAVTRLLEFFNPINWIGRCRQITLNRYMFIADQDVVVKSIWGQQIVLSAKMSRPTTVYISLKFLSENLNGMPFRACKARCENNIKVGLMNMVISERRRIF